MNEASVRRTAVGLLAVLATLLSPSAARAQCTQSTDCSGAELCVEGKCVAPAAPPEARSCASHADCPGSEICQDGTCVNAAKLPPKPGACEKDIDCGGDQVCELGTCVAAQPPPAPPPVAKPCARDTDCAGGQMCSAGSCVSVRQPAPAAAVPGTSPPAAGTTPSTPPPAFGEVTGYRTETSGVTSLIVAGVILLPLGYLTTIAVTGAMAGIDQAEGGDVGFAAIPVAGSWVSLANAIDNPATDTGFYAPLAVAGGMQATGLILLVLGLAIRTEEKVPIYGSVRDDEGPRWFVAPHVAPRRAGLAAAGVF